MDCYGGLYGDAGEDEYVDFVVIKEGEGRLFWLLKSILFLLIL